MKYRKFFIVLVVGLITLCINTRIFGKNVPRKDKIKDLLAFNEKMEIVIKEVYYRKGKIPPVEEGQKVIISIDQLKNMLLNNAIVVSGEEINYMFDYETVIIFGNIKTDNEKTYSFKYNLAGFGAIFLTETEYIQYGDITKMIDE